MGVEFTRTRAFAALATMLQLPGTETLRSVDIGVASPVVDLTEVIRSGLAASWTFARNVSVAAADSAQIPLDPFKVGNWDEVWRADRVATGEDLPSDHEALILSCGMLLSAATLTGAVIGPFQTSTNLTVGEILVPWWMADTTLDVGSTNLVADRAAGSPYIRPPPWFLPPSIDSRPRPMLRADFSAATDAVAMLQVVAAPRGVLPVV